MRILLTEGEYYNVFGIVQLKADARRIDANQSIQDAFLHEDIHFVQNFSTLFGVNKAIIGMSVLLKYFEAARNGYWDPQYTDEEDMVKTFFDIIAGDSERPDCPKCHAVDNITFENQFKDLYDKELPQYGLGTEVDTVTLHFYSAKGPEAYSFGGDAINESVAYLFEKLLFNSNDYTGHQFPYNACELVYLYIFGSKCSDYRALLAAGYISLLMKKPGITFVNLLKTLKDNNEFSVASVCKTLDTVPNISDKQFKLISERIDLLFPLQFDEASGSKLFESFKNEIVNANHWLKEKYKTAKENQECFTKFLLSAINIDNEDERKQCIEQILARYGKPVVYDGNGVLYDDNGNCRLMMLAPLALQKILLNKEEKCCPIIKSCKVYGGTPDENCEKDFSLHRSDTKVCMIRYYMYLIGLGGLEFQMLK